jgi:hypothetical protein
VGVGLANEDEVKAVEQGLPAKGLVGVQVIAQCRQLLGPMLRAVLQAEQEARNEQ